MNLRSLGWYPAAGVGVLAILLFVFEAELDAATASLALAGMGLLAALHAVYEMGKTLATAEHDAVFQYLGGASAPMTELRDQRRRLLRAIKELDFDHELGKLSGSDHDEIVTRYRLRAIDLGRQIDGGETLHPELVAELKRGAKEANVVAETPGRACAECGAANDPDARFCKACGKEMGS
ncbi:MAG: zinc ribbon domain-containing protein [Nannocystaceae bacterium]